ncbi:endonuclease/exonuclease/phosphatase family protein [Microbacterium sp. NPDC055357]
MTDPLIGPAAPPDLHVMTFNVRRRIDAPLVRRADRWAARQPRLAALLAAEQPTLVGAQEALPDQAAAIRAALGANYRFVGRGRRADGRGEGCPLFYDATRLELLEHSQEALSTTPARAGSRSWGAPLPRVLVRATLRDRATGACFVAVNTHLDPFSPWARIRSAHRIRRIVAGGALPAIVTGDFNATPGSAAVRELLSGGALRDTWPAAEERLTPAWGTFADYRRPRSGGARIDIVAVTPDVQVVAAGINARPIEGGWPSDHLPVQTRVRIGVMS